MQLNIKLNNIFAKMLSDSKKVIDIIFIMEGLGLVTRVSKNKLIFTGLRGMTNQLNG